MSEYTKQEIEQMKAEASEFLKAGCDEEWSDGHGRIVALDWQQAISVIKIKWEGILEYLETIGGDDVWYATQIDKYGDPVCFDDAGNAVFRPRD